MDEYEIHIVYGPYDEEVYGYADTLAGLDIYIRQCVISGNSYKLYKVRREAIDQAT